MEMPTWLNPENWSQQTRNAAADVAKAVAILVVSVILADSKVADSIKSITQK